ncbi:hypothetical protein ONZ45_g18040 [Pleurotus djamor]|nr:hypothetical protein ONZ45_g18040 [Pleurotus djamor]
MDVAQVFNEHSPAPLATSPVDVKPATEESKPPPSTPQVAVATPRHSINLPPASAEKRKSSYERYSGIAMPPLTEEATPTSTPVGTLARNVDVKTMEPIQSLAAIAPVEISIARSHEPLPDIDLSIFERQKPTTTANDIQTISIDVLSISGNSTNAVTKDPHIFYDSEVLCVVHRFKVKATGLVSSVVWGWQGKRGHLAEKEMNKLEELARRYGTSLVILYQHRETAEFVKVLGGLLITRQGNRTHWSADNTCMHLARTSAGVVFIDEYDLSIKNLCSGFTERAAIVQYAQSLSGDAGSVQELIEGQSDDDEMFWMILGSDDYAKADYWRWRSNFEHPDPQVWRVNSRSANASLERISHILDEPSPQDCVYLVDCIWEFFVVVGMKARGHQLDIRLAIHVAHDLSTSCAKSRPFVPPVHALILPTRIPCDLLLGLRGIEESWMNDNEVPDHMNLLPYENALQDLSTNTFELKVLKDHSMLPLGVDSSDLP